MSLKEVTCKVSKGHRSRDHGSRGQGSKGQGSSDRLRDMEGSRAPAGGNNNFHINGRILQTLHGLILAVKEKHVINN